MKVLLLPKDPNDEKNIILEIVPARAETKPHCSLQKSSAVYTRYTELQHWKVEVLSSSGIICQEA